jgi:glycosyltransferase involved in cell wall biosynthesis
LESISKQTFRDYEVIVTDDSPDDSVSDLCKEYKEELGLHYFKNKLALGTPANWNEGISRARGQWIKLMHDDDWFAHENSLQSFYEAAIKTDAKIICATYANVYEWGDRTEIERSTQRERSEILTEPLLLLSKNIIGPPSVTLVHSSIKERYDIHMKWRVDIDYYVRLIIREQKITFIDELLVNVGISESQVTNSCINLPEVELPEGYLLLKKYGTSSLKNIRVYDAWWRILRNVGIRRRDEIEQYTPSASWPVVILKMSDQQSIFPGSLLKIGAFSKLLMIGSYLVNRRYLNQNK